MKSPTEQRTGGEELPRAARDLLRKSARPAPPTAAERAAMAAMAARIAAVPLPPAPRGVWSKLAGLGGGKGVGIAGVVLAVGGATWLGVTMLGGGEAQESAPQAVSVSAKSMDEVAAPGAEERGAAVAETAPVENAGRPSESGGGESAKSGSPAESGSPVEGGSPAAVKGNPGAGRAPVIAGEPAAKSGSPSTARKASSGARVGPAVAVVAKPTPTEKGATAGKATAGKATAGKGAVAPAEDGAVPGAGKAAPVSACPAGSAASGDRAAEGPILASAAKALASSPLVTLACLQTLSKIGGPFQLRDEHAFLGFEASRRLGREADAKRFARALLRASPGSAYAAKAKAYLGDATQP